MSSNTFFTADLHFGHKMMVREYQDTGQCLRPFSNIDEMDDEIIRRWNSIVRKSSTVYILGDVSFRSNEQTLALLPKLNGRLHLIYGNHDEKRLDRPNYEQFFQWRKHYARIKVQDPTAPDGKSRRIVLCHYPLMTWHGSYRGTWHLHGHCHGNLADDKGQFRIDVGTDCHDFYPISFERVSELMTGRTYAPVDHHREKYDNAKDLYT